MLPQGPVLLEIRRKDRRGELIDCRTKARMPVDLCRPRLCGVRQVDVGHNGRHASAERQQRHGLAESAHHRVPWRNRPRVDQEDAVVFLHHGYMRVPEDGDASGSCCK